MYNKFLDVLLVITSIMLLWSIVSLNWTSTFDWSMIGCILLLTKRVNEIAENNSDDITKHIIEVTQYEKLH